MTDATGYIAAAYLVATLILGGYAYVLVRRLRREREHARTRDSARATPASSGATGVQDRESGSTGD